MGLLVNLEAVDKAGKTTQAKNVAARLRDAGLTAAGVRFPERPSNTNIPHRSHFPTGLLIDRYFEGKLVLFSGGDTLFRRESLAALDKAERTAIAGIIEEKLFQVIMSINRREGYEGPGGVLDLLQTNDVVVVERALSAQAYGVAVGVSPIMIKALEGDLPGPDITFLLDIDPAMARLRRAEEAPDRYEADSELQTRTRERYTEMVREDRREAERDGREPRFVRIDALRPAAEISDEIVAIISARLAETPDPVAD